MASSRCLRDAPPGERAHLVDRLGGDDITIAPALEPPADDFLGAAGQIVTAAERIDVRGVDEVDARIHRPIHDAARHVLFGLQTEGHRAERESRNGETSVTEFAVFHD